jgi:hypothetical protein
MRVFPQSQARRRPSLKPVKALYSEFPLLAAAILKHGCIMIHRHALRPSTRAAMMRAETCEAGRNAEHIERSASEPHCGCAPDMHLRSDPVSRNDEVATLSTL